VPVRGSGVRPVYDAYRVVAITFAIPDGRHALNEGGVGVPRGTAEAGPVRPGRAGLMARFKVPEGMTVQAVPFALDLRPEQAACVGRQCGGGRCACNWAVRAMKADIAAYRDRGTESPPPSMTGLRKRWNQAKDAGCADAVTGEARWPHISKEAFADG